MIKNRKRIIFSSICVILILALVGGTFAWFYLNENVSVAYGNSIFCEAGDSLEISLLEDGNPTRWTSLIDYSAGEFSVVDISGNGANLYRPGEVNELQLPVSFSPAVSSLDSEAAFDYVEMEVAFRSLSKMKVYLSEESFIEPVNPIDDGKNIYGDFSRDYIAGAMRVAVLENDEVKLLWAPNSQYELVQNGNGTYEFKDGADGKSTPESSYSYYVLDEEGEYVETAVTTDDYASKKFVVDSTNANKGTSGNSPVLVTLDPPAEGEYAQKTIKIRVWFEGTDREAHQALAGGNVNVKLKFVGIYKDQPDTFKQADVNAVRLDQNTGVVKNAKDGMVFSTDGQNWTAVTTIPSNLPILESGSSIYVKYPETNSHYETEFVKLTKD